MRALAGRTPTLCSFALVALTVVWTAGLVALPAPAAQGAQDACDSGGNPADEKKLKAASAERAEIQKELHTLFDTRELLKAEVETTAEERDELEKKLRVYEKESSAAADELSQRVRRSYMMSNSDPVLSMLAASDASDAVEQSRLLGLLTRGSNVYLERATSAERRTDAAADAAARTAEQLADLQSRYDDIEAKTEQVLERAKETEARLSAKVALQRAANGSNCPLPPGVVSSGLSCPVDQPRSYTDTWGAPRSGGRSHMGVDILAPTGTPLRAYENGTITRMNTSSLGGISLYMVGDNSNNQYYYTHLSAYVRGISVGEKVKAGQHIGFVGDTGNAAGIPHLHWEVRPGGGANVNPYPYAHAACG